MLAMVLTFGVLGIGCADEAKLQGTWVYESNTIKQMPITEMRQVMRNLVKQYYEAGLVKLEELREAESGFRHC